MEAMPADEGVINRFNHNLNPYPNITDPNLYLSKTSQIIFDLHPGFSHMEDEKGKKLHLFKKYFKMMFFTIQAIIGPYCYSF